MPIPKPKKGQKQDDFISYCMADKDMKAEFPKNKQRYVVCIKQGENKGVSEITEELLNKISLLLKEEKIDGSSVRETGLEVAEEIFDDVDVKIIDDMIKKIKKEYNPKDTEDAAGILTNMLRGD